MWSGFIYSLKCILKGMRIYDVIGSARLEKMYNCMKKKVNHKKSNNLDVLEHLLLNLDTINKLYIPFVYSTHTNAFSFIFSYWINHFFNVWCIVLVRNMKAGVMRKSERKDRNISQTISTPCKIVDTKREKLELVSTMSNRNCGADARSLQFLACTA